MSIKTPLEAFGGLATAFTGITVEEAALVIAPHCVVREAAGLPRVAGDWKGPQGFVDLMAAMQRTFPSFAFRMEKIVTNDIDLMAFRGRVSATLPAGAFDIPIVEFWTFEQGKAVDILPVWHDTKLVAELYQASYPAA